MVTKQFLNALMILLGIALVSNPYTNRLNPSLVIALTWVLTRIKENRPSRNIHWIVDIERNREKSSFSDL
jgi:hypothetical protein